jgi:hypothetical protein
MYAVTDFLPLDDATLDRHTIKGVPKPKADQGFQPGENFPLLTPLKRQKPMKQRLE